MSTRLLFCLILILFFALLSSHDNLELAAKCASGEYGYKAMRFDELARGPMPIYYMNEKARKKETYTLAEYCSGRGETIQSISNSTKNRY